MSASDAPKIDTEAPSEQPERQQKAEELSRDIQSQFIPADNNFKPGDQTKLNNELHGLGFPEMQIGADGKLQEDGKNVDNLVFRNGNLEFTRTGEDGKIEHVTLNMSEQPGLEMITNSSGKPIQATELDEQGNKHTTNYTYDANGKLQAVETDGKKTEIPMGATNVEADPASGIVEYRLGNSNVAVSRPDMQGRQTVVTSTNDRPPNPTGSETYSNKVSVQVMQDGKPVGEPVNSDNVSGTVTLNPDNSVTFPTNTKRSDDVSSVTGKTTIDASGQKTEVFNAPSGDVTMVHDASGKLTKYEQNGVSLLGKDGNPLWGGSDKNGESTFYDPKASMKDGELTYANAAGVTTTFDKDGNPIEFKCQGSDPHSNVKASDTNYTLKFNKEKNEWQFNQEGSDVWVHVDVPQMLPDGSVYTRQTTGFDQDKEIVFGDQIDGVHQGAGFWTGLAKGLVNGTIPGIVEDTDPGHASRSEVIGSFLGNLIGAADPYGKVGKGIKGFEALNKLYHLGLDAQKYYDLAEKGDYSQIYQNLTADISQSSLENSPSRK